VAEGWHVTAYQPLVTPLNLPVFMFVSEEWILNSEESPNLPGWYVSPLLEEGVRGVLGRWNLQRAPQADVFMNFSRSTRCFVMNKISKCSDLSLTVSDLRMQTS